MSILKPIEGHGAWEFKSPVPCPSDDILTAPLVSIEFNQSWIPAIYSALKVLTRPEAYVGSKTDINRCTQDAHNLFSTGTGTMPIGSIVPHLLASLPSNWLNCDGATHLRVDYPDLYAIIDAVYVIDADHFKTPDLRGRSPIGAGAGAGLTNRAVDAVGGEETHVLTVAELALHHHVVSATRNTTNVVENRAKGQGDAQTGTFITGDTGSDVAHNNMQPFTAIKYAVVAK